MTINQLIETILVKVEKLADEPIDMVRSGYPLDTATQAELIRECKQRGYTRGQMIRAILAEEFMKTTDYEIEG